MTAYELANKLQQMDPDTEIVQRVEETDVDGCFLGFHYEPVVTVEFLVDTKQCLIDII